MGTNDGEPEGEQRMEPETGAADKDWECAVELRASGSQIKLQSVWL